MLSLYTGSSGPWGRCLTSVSLSMKQLRILLLPPGWDASPLQGYPSIFANTHLYIWVKRNTVRVMSRLRTT